jgi:hypothetical protein
MSDDGREDLLQMLEAHGKQFLAAFDYPQLGSKRKENADAGPSKPSKKQRKAAQEESEYVVEEAEEWLGFGDAYENDTVGSKEGDSDDEPSELVAAASNCL